MTEISDGNSQYWAQYKHGKKEGLGFKYAGGTVSYYHYKNNMLKGFGIDAFSDG